MVHGARLLIITLMAADAVRAQANKLTAGGARVARIALQRRVSAQQREPIHVIAD